MPTPRRTRRADRRTGSSTSASTRTRTTATTTSASGSSRATPIASASAGTATWSGSHTDGDVLVVSEFTNGGGVSGYHGLPVGRRPDGCIDSDGDATAAMGCPSAGWRLQGPTGAGDNDLRNHQLRAYAVERPTSRRSGSPRTPRSASATRWCRPTSSRAGSTSPRSSRSQRERSALLLQHLRRRHTVVAGADRDAVRLRPRPAR